MLNCMEHYLTSGQVAEEKKIPSWLGLPQAVRDPPLVNFCTELKDVGQDDHLWKIFIQILIQAYGIVLLEQVAWNKIRNLTQKKGRWRLMLSSANSFVRNLQN